jgi:DNA-binding protein H-NS
LAKSYSDLQRQIAKLREEAEALRQREVVDVVGRIREAIAHYCLTPEDLFGKTASRKVAKKGKVTASGGNTKALSKAKGRKVAIKYRDAGGNTWTGRGNRPRWLVAALAAGKTLEEFRA